MNYRMIGRYIGYLLLAEALFLLPAAIISFVYGEQPTFTALGITALVAALAGLLLTTLLARAQPGFYAREGFVVAGGGWLAVSLVGALPFYLTGEIPLFIDAVFESVSGFTTTGASMVVDLEAMSRGLLFWRCTTTWLGGIGILAFILGIVRTQSGAGFTIHLLRAESAGPQVGKLRAKTKDSVRILLQIYLGFTGVVLVSLLLCGVTLFDAVCTAMGVASTGGFAIHNDSLGSFPLAAQILVAVFMALAGISFTLYYLLLRKDWKSVARDSELRLYLGSIVVCGIAIAFSLFLFGGYAAGESAGLAFFTSTSVLSSTTYTISDFNNWPQFCRSLVLVMMIVGGMGGSTASGFKMSRVLIMLKSVKAGMHRLLHPRSVKAVKVSGKTVHPDVLSGTLLFLSVYVFIAFVSFLIISVDGNTLETNISAIVSTLNNVGPGFGSIGITDNYSYFSIFSKIILIFNMLVGRLEIFPILLLLSPSTWKRKG